ncbi:MAG: hypothetical protein RL134_1759 [Actinomycetota bacterium]|jgi:hypothetical protein
MTLGSRPQLARILAAAAVTGLALTACSGGSQEAASSSGAPSSSAAASSAAASSSASPSPSGSKGTETILAVLCDEAAPEQVAAIEAAMLPDFTVSQLVDVRTDDDGKHAILGFVEGPGLAVLAQWTGTGLTLEGLAAADEFATQVTDLPAATPDQETEDLLGQTVTCYSAIYAPEDGDKKKKGDKNAE